MLPLMGRSADHLLPARTIAWAPHLMGMALPQVHSQADHFLDRGL